MFERSDERWPIDLTIFAVLSAMWSVVLVIRAFFQETLLLADPLQAVIGGTVFYGADARWVLLVEAAIFWAFGMGILARRKWALLLALGYMIQVVLSHFVFVLAHLSGQSVIHVRRAALEGPSMVLIALYLWICSSELIFRRAAGN